MTNGHVHRLLRQKFGPARDHACSCGAPAEEWAYQHTSKNELKDEKGSPYSEDLADYAPMCKRCHRNLDADSYRANGQRNGKIGGAILAQRVKEDPEFRESITNRVRGHHVKMKTDPATKAAYREKMKETNSRTLPCSCGRSFNPGNLVLHTRATGHEGVKSDVQ